MAKTFASPDGRMAIEPNHTSGITWTKIGSQMWYTTPIERDGEDIILITGDAHEGETGWIVAEMPYNKEDETLRLEQERRAMMISGVPLAYKVLQDIRTDALEAVGHMNLVYGELPETAMFQSIILQAERALAYMPWLDEEKEE